MNQRDLTQLEINKSQLTLSYNSMLSSQIGMIAAAIILVTALRNHFPLSVLLLWLAFFTSTAIFRLTIRRYFLKTIEKPIFNESKWNKLFIIGVILSSLAWGSAATISCVQLSERASAIEILAQDAHLTSIGEPLLQLKKIFELTRQEIKKLLII